jgi:hypothetical protein
MDVMLVYLVIRLIIAVYINIDHLATSSTKYVFGGDRLL